MSTTIYRKLRPLNLIASLLRLTARILSQWLIILIALAIISPVTPHLRWQYDQYADANYMFNCRYIGPRGLVRWENLGHCPLFVWIDHRK